VKINYSTQIELPKVVISFKIEGYIHLHYKNEEVNLKDSEELFLTVRKNSPWEKCPFLISGEAFANNDKESKIFNSSPKVTKHMSAQAFITDNTAQKLSVNFFVKFFSPKVPLKAFNNESEAEAWLLTFVPENIQKTNNYVS
jgi:hypothetical protein